MTHPHHPQRLTPPAKPGELLRDIPVIVVMPSGTPISPWLRYHSTKIVHSFDDAIKWIEDHE